MTPHGAALRILVAVQPAVLQDALVQVLNSAGLDQVETLDVELDTTERGLTGYDAAVVSELAPPGIRARVVITLPDQFGSRASAPSRPRARGPGRCRSHRPPMSSPCSIGSSRPTPHVVTGCRCDRRPAACSA